MPNAVIHSVRHSFDDRLENARVQSEIVDKLSGWSKKSVRQGYINGFALRCLSEAIDCV